MDTRTRVGTTVTLHAPAQRTTRAWELPETSGTWGAAGARFHKGVTRCECAITPPEWTAVARLPPRPSLLAVKIRVDGCSGAIGAASVIVTCLVEATVPAAPFHLGGPASAIYDPAAVGGSVSPRRLQQPRYADSPWIHMYNMCGLWCCLFVERGGCP